MNMEKRCGMLLTTVSTLCQWLQQWMEKYAIQFVFRNVWTQGHSSRPYVKLTKDGFVFTISKHVSNALLLPVSRR